MLVFLVSERLDLDSRRQWELSSSGKEYPKFESLKLFLENRCRALEASITKQPIKVQKPFFVKRPDNKLSTSSFHVVPSQARTCIVCTGDHVIYKCVQFKNLNERDRLAAVRKHHMCFNCLRQFHVSKDCPSRSTCQKCNAKHHTLLHMGEAQSEKQASDDGESSPSSVSNHCANHEAVGQKQILLSTALVKIKDSAGNYQPCRVLLDSGSQASFITEPCIQRLGLKRLQSDVAIIGIAQNGAGRARGQASLHIKSNNSGFTIDVEALVMTRLTGVLPQRQLCTDHWDHLRHLVLADPLFNKPGKVDVILGADVFSELLTPGMVTADNDKPSAYNTQFGWIISGKVSDVDCRTAITVGHAAIELQDQLRKFWEIEEMPNQRYLSAEEQFCEDHFETTHVRSADGRYKVKLPLRNETPTLGNSKEIATRRLKQVERRLDQLPGRKSQYDAFMEEYLFLEHMEPVPFDQQGESPPKTNYLPHHFVLKEDSSTTKLRVVFDASARTSSNVSLNDRLMIGPKLQDDIWKILMRFRLHKIGLTADIEKMYRQIEVMEPDTDLQRILWRKHPAAEIQEFRLKTVTYGTASAPYLATKTLQQLAKDEAGCFPVASKVALRDFYVDDLISGAGSVEEALQLQAELLSMLNSGGFHLRKWSSNEHALLEAVPEPDRELEVPLEINSADNTVKTLGLRWKPAQDNFIFVVNIQESNGHPSKRRILSEISRLFDPLGWLAPVIILAKILLQRLWLAGLAWDQELPNGLESEWLRLKGQLKNIGSVQLPRCVITNSQASGQIHGFCDASESAYGAVIYLRTETRDGVVSVNILCAKTRVAPVKQISLPRLELCGAVLLSKLVKETVSTLPITLDDICAWTDSQVVLAWIASLPRSWKTFVANRVSVIHECIPPSQWHHVPSADNPADAASRGLFPTNLINNKLWWNGPSWLKLQGDAWPQQQIPRQDSVCLEEQRKKVYVMVATPTGQWDLIYRYSSLAKLQRVTAYCLRFIANCKLPGEKRVLGPLGIGELHSALLVCVKTVQEQEFTETIACLQRGQSAPPNLLSLCPFQAEDGVLRVGGRIRHSRVAYDQRFPMLLPKNHHFTRLVILDSHLRQLHAGPQATLAAIRLRFWIIGGRSAVRLQLHKCHTCFRDSKTSKLSQIMGDLPIHRLEPVRPFLRSGVDFAGPFSIRPFKNRNCRVFKAYIALFVCFATKAVHLELVSDLTTAAFIAALKRFVARRGRCTDIYSDNATNFVGACAKLNQLSRAAFSQQHNDAITDVLANDGIKWHFIPARAPHFGGLWEAGIKSTKTHLRRIVGETILTFEEFTTFLVQIEACLNSRPLCPLSSDPNDLEALTPAHFIIGQPLTSIPEPDITKLTVSSLSRWQLMQRMYQHFWKRWNREYLTQLQQRNKWKTEHNSVQCGDFVLIKEDNMPPLKWAKGRITKIHPGKDNKTRVVTVRTAKGEFKRPVIKLCLLPVN